MTTAGWDRVDAAGGRAAITTALALALVGAATACSSPAVHTANASLGPGMAPSTAAPAPTVAPSGDGVAPASATESAPPATEPGSGAASSSAPAATQTASATGAGDGTSPAVVAGLAELKGIIADYDTRNNAAIAATKQGIGTYRMADADHVLIADNYVVTGVKYVPGAVGVPAALIHQPKAMYAPVAADYPRFFFVRNGFSGAKGDDPGYDQLAVFTQSGQDQPWKMAATLYPPENAFPAPLEPGATSTAPADAIRAGVDLAAAATTYVITGKVATGPGALRVLPPAAASRTTLYAARRGTVPLQRTLQCRTPSPTFVRTVAAAGGPLTVAATTCTISDTAAAAISWQPAGWAKLWGPQNPKTPRTLRWQATLTVAVQARADGPRLIDVAVRSAVPLTVR